MPLYQRNHKQRDRAEREVCSKHQRNHKQKDRAEREACSKDLLVKPFDQVAKETHLEAASLTTIQTSDTAQQCILQAF